MTFSELKEWINSLPEDFNNFQVMNGGETVKEDIYMYRIDSPITTCVVDKESKQIIFLNDFYDDKKES
jgi:Fe-S-cluster formation regulator IscX/YfhJ